MSDDLRKLLARRARIAAGCSWGPDAHQGVGSQEQEVRRILRDCAQYIDPEAPPPQASWDGEERTVRCCLEGRKAHVQASRPAGEDRCGECGGLGWDTSRDEACDPCEGTGKRRLPQPTQTESREKRNERVWQKHLDGGLVTLDEFVAKRGIGPQPTQMQTMADTRDPRTITDEELRASELPKTIPLARPARVLEPHECTLCRELHARGIN